MGVRHGCFAAALAMFLLVQRPALRQQRRRRHHGAARQGVSSILHNRHARGVPTSRLRRPSRNASARNYRAIRVMQFLKEREGERMCSLK